MENINYRINPKENIYFGIRLFLSIIGYFAMLLLILFVFELPLEKSVGFLFLLSYVGIFALFLFFSTGIFVGHIKGNAIRITKIQFPDIYAILEKHCYQLGMDIPASYILESGGILNAFATKFLGRNYVVIYSEILELAYEQGQEALEFVIAHELGHIKRNHKTKRLLLFPSAMVPFLASAYSRACEYTCDNIGKSLSPNGAMNGLLILAAGKQLYKKVNPEEYINNERYEISFWKWFAEKTSSHPHLPKRLDNVGISKPIIKPIIPKETEKELSNQENEGEDYSRFMPR